MKTLPPENYDLRLIIKFPSGYRSGYILSRLISIYDATTEKPIDTVESMTIHADSRGMLWADVRMFATPDGEPVRSGKPYIGRDHEIITGDFTATIVEVKAQASYNEGFAAHEAGHAKVTA